MNPNKKSGTSAPPQDHSSQRLNDDREKIIEAREEAGKDIEEDVEFSAHSPNDDLDEGETARLGEGKNDLI